MKNFVYIYDNGGDMGDMPMEEVKAAWMAWFEKLGDKLVDAGNPFNDGAQAITKGGVMAVTKPATGYSIVKASSMDEAIDTAQGCPLLQSDTAAVLVYETLPM